MLKHVTTDESTNEQTNEWTNEQANERPSKPRWPLSSASGEWCEDEDHMLPWYTKKQKRKKGNVKKQQQNWDNFYKQQQQ